MPRIVRSAECDIGNQDSAVDHLDRPRTFRQAADALGVGYHVIQRAARRGIVPTMRIGSSRKYVRLRDFLELMKCSENG